MKLFTTIVAIGAINWGLVGAFDFNLVQVLLGDGVLANAVYIFIGITGVIFLLKLCKCSKACKAGCKTGCGSCDESAIDKCKECKDSKTGLCKKEECDDDDCDCEVCNVAKEPLESRQEMK